MVKKELHQKKQKTNCISKKSVTETENEYIDTLTDDQIYYINKFSWG
jgi:hypothetical protein